jgi:Tol biopolymer transport system component
VRQFYHGITASFICVVLAADVATARAQGGGNNGAPAGWQVDTQAGSGGSGTSPLRTMGPGVHLTAEGSGRYYRLADTFADSAIATVAFQQLPGSSGSLGLFVSTLDDRIRVQVLVRGDNQYSVVAVQRGVDTTLVNWTAVSAGDMSSGNPKIVVSVGRGLGISINGGAAVAVARLTTLTGQLRVGLLSVGSVDAHIGAFTLDRPAVAATAAAGAHQTSKPNASLPVWSPDGRTIAFAVRQTAEGYDQVHLIDVDGTHVRQITSGIDNNTGPVFSPDGARVAYRSFHFANQPAAGAMRNMNDVTMKIISVARDGTDLREIAAATIVGAPRWSPDSRALLFSALNGKLADLNITINVADADGTNRQSLGPSPRMSLSSGSWAPDSRRVAFGRPTANGSEIRIQDRDGGNSRALIKVIAYQQDPVWSPDGKCIAFMGSDHAIAMNGAGQALYVVQADGSGPRVLIHDAQHVANVSFSPNGMRLLFQDVRGGNTDIYSIATDGTAELRLTSETGMDESPSWSPDGRRVLFQSDRDAGGALGGTGIFVMDADGGHLQRIY